MAFKKTIDHNGKKLFVEQVRGKNGVQISSSKNKFLNFFRNNDERSWITYMLLIAISVMSVTAFLAMIAVLISAIVFKTDFAQLGLLIGSGAIAACATTGIALLHKKILKFDKKDGTYASFNLSRSEAEYAKSIPDDLLGEYFELASDPKYITNRDNLEKLNQIISKTNNDSVFQKDLKKEHDEIFNNVKSHLGKLQKCIDSIRMFLEASDAEYKERAKNERQGKVDQESLVVLQELYKNNKKEDNVNDENAVNVFHKSKNTELKRQSQD